MFEWIAIFLVIFGLLAGAAWFFRGQFLGGTTGARDRRIGLSEIVSIDGNRKLMLVYRDGMEHLVMTGGPIDVVIEQNIGPPPARRGQFDGRVPANNGPSFGQGPGLGNTGMGNPGAVVGASPLSSDADNSVTGRLRQRVSPTPTLDSQ